VSCPWGNVLRDVKSKQVHRVNIFCHGVLLGSSMNLQVRNVCRPFYSYVLFLMCKNIAWVITSAVALHEYSGNETHQEHVPLCLKFHSLLVSSAFFLPVIWMFYSFCLFEPHKGKGHPRTWLKGPDGIEVLFLNLSARWGGWSVPSPGCFTPGKDPVPLV
jgi:hypothetical protein